MCIMLLAVCRFPESDSGLKATIPLDLTSVDDNECLTDSLGFVSLGLVATIISWYVLRVTSADNSSFGPIVRFRSLSGFPGHPLA